MIGGNHFMAGHHEDDSIIVEHKRVKFWILRMFTQNRSMEIKDNDV